MEGGDVLCLTSNKLEQGQEDDEVDGLVSYGRNVNVPYDDILVFQEPITNLVAALFNDTSE